MTTRSKTNKNRTEDEWFALAREQMDRYAAARAALADVERVLAVSQNFINAIRSEMLHASQAVGAVIRNHAQQTMPQSFVLSEIVGLVAAIDIGDWVWRRGVLCPGDVDVPDTVLSRSPIANRLIADVRSRRRVSLTTTPA